jgi:protein phosphatase
MTVDNSSPAKLRVDAWSETHVGHVREHNEDAYRSTPSRGIYLVADGMGGHVGGEIASSLAVDAAHEALRAHVRPTGIGEAIRYAFARANLAVLDAARRDPSLRGMGTTLLLGLATRTEFAFGWAGDSRIYRYSHGVLTLLTRDHGANNVLYNAVGLHDAKVEMKSVPLSDGDRFILCSDGLSSYVPESVISYVMKHNKEPKAAAEMLIREALLVGAPDNVTVTVLRVRS